MGRGPECKALFSGPMGAMSHTWNISPSSVSSITGLDQPYARRTLWPNPARAQVVATPARQTDRHTIW
eukprot:8524749-Alexandrium_andersonii.AAC.1